MFPLGVIGAQQHCGSALAPCRDAGIHLPRNGRLDGRLAQLVERLLYTQDVGGSSPSPPTSLRSLRELRLGRPRIYRAVSEASEGCRAVARRAKALPRDYPD